MATLVLSTAGAAIGSSFGGVGAVVGRAIGATIGRMIDQKILGSGSEPVERGRAERLRVTSSTEGTAIAHVVGSMRVGGHVIWATNFVERADTSGGGKGTPSTPETKTYSYAISVAIGLCEGDIRGVGRVWADGTELDLSTINMRVYTGTETQLPDPLIEAVEGAGHTPAYRGLAYVVFEDLDLTPFGNRVPQFSFEINRIPTPQIGASAAASDMVRAVAMVPGRGEYSLATKPVTFEMDVGQRIAANVSSEGGGTDFTQSLAQLRRIAPNVESVSLIYSWFGDDLRAGSCNVAPKVEFNTPDGKEMTWRAGGITRSQAQMIGQIGGQPVYGGTPADASVIQAIRAIHDGGQAVLFCPFLLMDILQGNGLPDPYGGAEQPALPWRGRITGDLAPDQPGTPDQTAANRVAVDAFFGTATAADFTVQNGAVSYSGPPEWSYARFVLHSAALCAAAGGVAAFCIGSEMRALTQMRDDLGFPAVQKFKTLAQQVRQILPNAKLSYAADWSEYFGYHPQDGTGDVYFHLDPLWSDPNIDFIGIDNYMPLSDWRDGQNHADASAGSIYNLDYLHSNIEGGEGYDWYYASDIARDDQTRTAISDTINGVWTPGTVIQSLGAGSTAGMAQSAAERGAPAVFRGRLTLPATPSDALIWKAGGGMIAASLGVRDGGAMLRLRAGRGDYALTQSDAATAVLDIPTASLPFDNAAHDLMWELSPQSPGRVRLWVDDVLVGTAQTSTGQSLGLGQSQGAGLWAGPEAGHWLSALPASGSAPIGEPTTAWMTQGAGNLEWLAGIRLTPSQPLPFTYRYKDIKGWWENTHHNRIGGAMDTQPTSWVPMSKPVWFTEIGCPAIDKGTNQPNTVLNPQSSQSRAPYYSNARRDDLIQAQYLRAMMSYWQNTAHNPVSPIYGGPMLDMGRAHVWAWDARPWPAFPHDLKRWPDGANWMRGHWVTGRMQTVTLDLVVAELCEQAGVTSYDVSRLHGIVRGHLSGETETPRARLQTLMLAYGFQAAEIDGQVVFFPMPVVADQVITQDMTAIGSDDQSGFSEIRAAARDETGRVRLAFFAAESAFEDISVEAASAHIPDQTVSVNNLPLSLTRAEGFAIAERWLSEAQIARDTLRFDLPPSQRSLSAGALIARDDGSTWRIDRVEDRGFRSIEATRVEPSTLIPSDEIEDFAPISQFQPPLPVDSEFLDIPLISGQEIEHAPHLAVSAKPWSGSVAVYASDSDDGFAFNTLIPRGATIGHLQTPLARAKPGLWDRGDACDVRIFAGGLSAATENAVLNGQNWAAIGHPTVPDWEIIQFADAQLINPGLWRIGRRLRGQQGTDAVMPDLWPVGTKFVLLDGAPTQLTLPEAARGLDRYWRIGPSRKPLTDPTYTQHIKAFYGVGLRPYSPVHLKANWASNGDLEISWTRRTRIDGDSWQGLDVPLGEASENYALRISDATGTKRSVGFGNSPYALLMAAFQGLFNAISGGGSSPPPQPDTPIETPSFTYTATMQGDDGISLPFYIEVAQISQKFGIGPFARIDIT
jgi:hypothetical protein